MQTALSRRCLLKCLGRKSTLSCLFSSISCSPLRIGFSSQLRDLSQAGDHLGLLSLFLHFSREEPSPKPHKPIYLSLLKAAGDVSSHSLVLSLHGHIYKSGCLADVATATSVLDALCKCSDVGGARKMFDDMSRRDVATWNAMICGYARNGSMETAALLFSEMGPRGVKPNALTLSILLKVCSGGDDERLGRSVHGYILRHLELKDTFLDNSLLFYYSNAVDFRIAELMFERMLRRDIMSWNAMIVGYAQRGFHWRALVVFNLLRKEGFSPDLFTLDTVLQACAQIGNDAVDLGQAIHGILTKAGFPLDVYVENNLLLMYCKCGMVSSGHSYFDRMEVRNAVSWNILVDGYVKIKCPEKSLELVKSMRSELEISSDILVSALQAARILTDCQQHVMCIHCLVIVTGFGSGTYINSSLIAAYGDCGKHECARKILDNFVPARSNTTVCWNAMLSIYIHNWFFSEALDLLSSMHVNGCRVDSVTLVNAISICSQLLDLRLGKVVHGYIIRNKFEHDVVVTTAMLGLYANCRALNQACCLFLNIPTRNIVTWNTMLHGCLQNGFPRTSLKLFHLMQQQNGIMPDATSLVGVIEAIAQRGHEGERKYIHEYAIETGLADDEFVINSLIAMHARFHDFNKASMVFDKASKHRTVTWNAMISEYSNYGLVNKAIATFHLLKINNVAPDSVTLLCLLRACTNLGSLTCIMWIHAIVCKIGYESDMLVGTSLLDGYAKCGDLKTAREIFDKLKYKSIISWNSMIQSYGMHGDSEEVHKLFSQLQLDGLDPSVITFLNAISACSHGGDVEMGKYYIDIMMHAQSFNPTRELFSTLADLLGRNGLINEARQALEKMPTDMRMYAWGALLGACRIQGNFEVGLAEAKKLFELYPSCHNYHLLLSNMYAEAGNWMTASKIRKDIEKFRLTKVPGWSIVEGYI